MASRRLASARQPSIDHEPQRSALSQNKPRKKPPPFLYVFPLVPVIIMILMSGKPKRDDVDSSFMPPPGLVQRPQRQAVQTVTAMLGESEKEHNFLHQPSKEETNSVPSASSETEDSSLSSRQEFKPIMEAELVQSPNTVVTGYFSLKSKFAKEEYIKWMSNMLSLQDAMVVFTSPEMVTTMQELRAHARNRTVVIPMDLAEVELAKKYDAAFWQKQLDKDPEKRVHRSYELFWIWLSKSFLVKTAIELNFFGSDVYMWSDIGCFRNARYRGKEMIQQRHLIPVDRIFQMAHHAPQAPPYVWWNDKYQQKPLFYHSGSQMIGYKDTWMRFHKSFLETVSGFLERDLFIGEDQTVLQSTCLRVTTLCAYVRMSDVSDNHYFGLRYVLHFGGNYTYWYPPEGLPAERSDVQNKTLLEPMKPPPKPSKEAIRAA